MGSARKQSHAVFLCTDKDQLKVLLDRLREHAETAHGIPKIGEIRRLLREMQVVEDGAGFAFGGNLFTTRGALCDGYHQAKTYINQHLGRGFPAAGSRVELHKPARTRVLRLTVLNDQRSSWAGIDPQYQRFTDLLRDRSHIDHAKMIQQSGDSVRSLLMSHLIERNANIDLYVHDPRVAPISCEQAGKIRFTVMNMRNYFSRYIGKSTSILTIYLYPQQASLRAVMVDNDALAMGWYIHTRAMKDIHHPDAFDLQGAFGETIETCSSNADFAPLRSTFESMVANIHLFNPPPALRVDFSTGELQALTETEPLTAELESMPRLPTLR